ncbi:MAG: hypothetical protein JST54_18435 [Deltaproteobacteria bacterium]|nr:hypothetical protein [Deltaproteobacteria bacterium]
MDGVGENLELRAWAQAKSRERASGGAVPRRPIAASRRSLKSALSTGGKLTVIAEPARRSPEEGLLRADLDLGEFACASVRAGVAALAFPADPRFGVSSSEWAWLVQDELRLPVLLHDLLVAPEQVEHARGLGADAVWLHAGVLDDAVLRACVEHARSLGMDALVEGRSQEELARAMDAGAELLCVSGFDEMGALNEDAPLELLREVPREVLRVVRGPVSGEFALRPLRGEVQAMWICGPACMPRDTFGYLEPLVAELRGD